MAYLAATSRDVGAAEDALSEALLAALRTWPERGIPARPEAWLLTTARRQLIGRHRHDQVAARAAPTLALIDEEIRASRLRGWSIPDKRLELCFVCAHPAIDERLRAPLMLQVVLGLDAARIASAFLVAPATMGQRLSRAKAKVRAAGIGFAIPERDQLPERLESVLEAIYGAFTDRVVRPGRPRPATARGWPTRPSGWDGSSSTSCPTEPEPEALLATMLFAHARRDARRDADGRYVPLPDQDPRRWDPADLLAAETHLAQAARRAPAAGPLPARGGHPVPPRPAGDHRAARVGPHPGPVRPAPRSGPDHRRHDRRGRGRRPRQRARRRAAAARRPPSGAGRRQPGLLGRDGPPPPRAGRPPRGRTSPTGEPRG